MPKYSVVVPFHNEEENVTALYDQLKAVMEQVGDSFELVLVDDGSTDHTAQAAAAQRSVIEYLRSAHGLARLTPALREVAELRLKYPDESLAELGRRCNPPIAKPTVSSRLGALVRLADHLITEIRRQSTPVGLSVSSSRLEPQRGSLVSIRRRFGV